MSRSEVACDLLREHGFDDAAEVLEGSGHISGYDCDRCVEARNGNHHAWCPITTLTRPTEERPGRRWTPPSWWRAVSDSPHAIRSALLVACANHGMTAEETLVKMAEAYEGLLLSATKIAEMSPPPIVIREDD